jgi:hypothetical protein
MAHKLSDLRRKFISIRERGESALMTNTNRNNGDFPLQPLIEHLRGINYTGRPALGPRFVLFFRRSGRLRPENHDQFLGQPEPITVPRQADTGTADTDVLILDTDTAIVVIDTDTVVAVDKAGNRSAPSEPREEIVR